MAELLEEVAGNLRARADEHFRKLSRKYSSIDEMKDAQGLVLAGWCGSKECSDVIEGKLELGALGFNRDSETTEKCVVCGKDGKIAAFSRSY